MIFNNTDILIIGDYMHVEILLKEIREKKNISLEQLSRTTGISTSHLNYIERGVREPTISMLCRIAIALKVDVKELYRVIN